MKAKITFDGKPLGTWDPDTGPIGFAIGVVKGALKQREAAKRKKKPNRDGKRTQKRK